MLPLRHPGVSDYCIGDRRIIFYGKHKGGDSMGNKYTVTVSLRFYHIVTFNIITGDFICFFALQTLTYLKDSAGFCF